MTFVSLNRRRRGAVAPLTAILIMPLTPATLQAAGRFLAPAPLV